MQPPSTSPSSPISNNASPDLGTACPPKRYNDAICSCNSAEIKAQTGAMMSKGSPNRFHAATYCKLGCSQQPGCSQQLGADEKRA